MVEHEKFQPINPQKMTHRDGTQFEVDFQTVNPERVKDLNFICSRLGLGVNEKTPTSSAWGENNTQKRTLVSSDRIQGILDTVNRGFDSAENEALEAFQGMSRNIPTNQARKRLERTLDSLWKDPITSEEDSFGLEDPEYVNFLKERLNHIIGSRYQDELDRLTGKAQKVPVEKTSVKNSTPFQREEINWPEEHKNQFTRLDSKIADVIDHSEFIPQVEVSIFNDPRKSGIIDATCMTAEGIINPQMQVDTMAGIFAKSLQQTISSISTQHKARVSRINLSFPNADYTLKIHVLGTGEIKSIDAKPESTPQQGDDYLTQKSQAMQPFFSSREFQRFLSDFLNKLLKMKTLECEMDESSSVTL